MTRKEFVTKATELLADSYSPREAKAISVRLITHFLGLSDYEYSIEPNVVIPKPYLDKIDAALEELAADRPIQYVIGYEEFAGQRFKVSESVLIPRPETEQLCRIIVEDWRNSGVTEPKILDLGTGSGCIAYTLAAAFPKASVTGVDIEDAALEVARSQEIFIDSDFKHPLRNVPEFIKADILDDPLHEIADVDILVSNPPYVLESEKDYMAANVLDYEPDSALFVPDSDPLRFYKALAVWSENVIRLGGKGYFEINEAYGPATVALFESHGFSDVELLEDIHGKPRFVRFTKWF